MTSRHLGALDKAVRKFRRLASNVHWKCAWNSLLFNWLYNTQSEGEHVEAPQVLHCWR